jgi:hypothetical protein
MKNRENLTFPTFTYERSINYDRKNIVTWRLKAGIADP